MDAVKEHITGLGHGPKRTFHLPFGESEPVDVNTSSIGKQHNRRVEILVTLERPKMMPEPIAVVPPEQEEIEGDTMVTYPNGTILVLKKQDYFIDPFCVSLVEYLDGESVREAGLTTTSTDGAQLISGGILDINMCGESKCVTVLIPTRTVCGQTLPFTEWTAESDNKWREKTGRPLPVIMINDQNYYEMTVCQSGRVNCDVRIPAKKCKLFRPKSRIKLKNGYRIKNIQLASDEPMTIENPIRTRKRKAVFWRTCPCTDPLIFIEATNKKGELKTIEFSPLNEFDKREAFGVCKTNEVEKKILFFKIKKKTKYRKYIIRDSDFD